MTNLQEFKESLVGKVIVHRGIPLKVTEIDGIDVHCALFLSTDKEDTYTGEDLSEMMLEKGDCFIFEEEEAREAFRSYFETIGQLQEVKA